MKLKLTLTLSLIIAALLLSCQALSFSCSNVTEIPVTECEDLVLLYNSTNGAHWTNKTGWLTTNTPCSWYGVGCSMGHVTLLPIWNNQLSGTIPNFTNLPNLVWLDLSKNQLTGTIPNFNNLPNLKLLVAFDNQLNGPIPNFNNLPMLEELSIHSNQLIGNIPNFNNSPKLTFLSLANNQLSGTIPNLNWSSFWGIQLFNNCGLVAYNEAQATILNGKDRYWQVRNSDCSHSATPTPMPQVIVYLPLIIK